MRSRKLFLAILLIMIPLPLFYSRNRVFAQPAQSSDWPMFSHDPTNTGYADVEGPDGPNLVWKFFTHRDVYSSPAIVDGKLFIGDIERYFYCLDSSDGSLIWKIRMSDATSSPAVVNDRLYVGSMDGYLSCLDPSDGSPIWRYKAEDQISSPTVDHGKVYFGQANLGAADGYIFCINASDGSFVWNYHTGAVACSPAVISDRVYAGSYDGYLYCLDSSDGSLVWRYNAGSPVYSSPAVVDGRVYASSSYNYSIFCLNASDGSLIWTSYMDFIVASSPAVAHGKVYTGSYDDYIYCFDADNGNLVWRYQTGSYVTASPAVTKERVYIGSEDGYIYCLNANSGILLWNYSTWGKFDSSPAIADGKLYIASYWDYERGDGEGGAVYCFTATDSYPGVQFTFNARETLNLALHVNSTAPIFVNAWIRFGSISTPSHLNILGSVFAISSNISSGFNIVIRYYYTDEQLTALGFDESKLAIYYENRTSDQWIELPTSVDVTSNVLIAEVNHIPAYANFGVFHNPQQDANPGEQGDNNDGDIFLSSVFGFVMAIAAVGFFVTVASKSSTPVAEPLVEPPSGLGSEEEATSEEITQETEEAEPFERALPSEAICSYCGRVCPPDAVYCMRCGRYLL